MQTWKRSGHEKLGKSKVLVKGTCRVVSRWMGYTSDDQDWMLGVGLGVGKKRFVLFRGVKTDQPNTTLQGPI